MPAGDESIPGIPDHRELVIVAIGPDGVSALVRFLDVQFDAVRIQAFQEGASPVLRNPEPDESVLVADRQIVLA